MPRINYSIIILLILIAAGIQANAQDYINMGQKWLSRPLFNPAATGSTPFMEITAFGREQWIGIDGAPSTQLLHGHFFFPEINSGVGATITNEFIGFYHSLDIKLAYSYHLELDQDVHLSFGLSGDMTWMFRDDSKIDFENPYIVVPPLFETKMIPNFDAGLELHHKWIKVGLSVLRIMDAASDYNGPKIERTFQAYIFNRFNIGNQLAISPSLLGSLSHGLYDGEFGSLFFYRRPRNAQSLVRLRTRYNDTYDFLWAGAYMHFNGAVSIMAGISITDQLRLGYAYEHSFNLNHIQHVSSHEIMLSWRLPVQDHGPRRYLCEDC
jgi:type IX secretion system PorP/SprF family membrane protein